MTSPRARPGPARLPAPVLLELLQEPGPGQGPLVAGHLGAEGLHQRRRPGLRHAEEPLDVAQGDQGPVEVLELADGVGDGEQPPGLRGHRAGPQRQGAAVPSGGGVNGFARATSAGNVDTPSDGAVAPPGRLCVRLDVGAGGRGSGPAVFGRHRRRMLDAQLSTKPN